MRAVFWGLAVLGGAALTLAAGLAPMRDAPALWWVLFGPTPFYLVGLLAFLRHPDHPAVRWLLANGVLFSLDALGEQVVSLVTGSSLAVPMTFLAWQWAGLGSVWVAVGLLGLFPTGRAQRRLERRTLWLVGGLAAALPVAVALTHPVLVGGVYADPNQRSVISPLYDERFAALAPVAGELFRDFPLLVFAGLGLLFLRYRRASPPQRHQIRWLLAGGAGGFITAVVQVYLLLWLGFDSPVNAVLAPALWLVTLTLVLGSLLVGLFYEGVFGIDRPARRRLVYRVLWTLIAVGYVCAAAGLGLLASQVLPTGAAVVIAVVAALGFQPARRRLERLADRWVFGARLDGYGLLAQFGASLDKAPGPAPLLQELAETVRSGLDLSWARVRVDSGSTDATVAAAGDAADGTDPALVVPVSQAGMELGQIECGPRRDGSPFLAEDQRLLGYLAGQAAAAVHNLYLTAELSARLRLIQRQAAELTASRERVVSGQDAERRRIQRDLHDGVQQEVVALTAKLGLARQRLDRGDPGAGELLAEVDRDLGTLLSELREFAYSIHPPVLTDRGLLEAIEAHAARLPLAMAVRADPVLRAVRYPPQVEATAWYGLAEALSNVVKHAEATQVDVSLHQPDGRLVLTVRDDGCGFDPTGVRGLGLAGLADRLDIVGGTLDVDSSTGLGTMLRMEIPLRRQEVADG